LRKEYFMPTTPTYPGVYVEEIPSGVRTITGVATSITAFVGRALRGPVNEPVHITSFADFERIFGGLWSESTMSYALQQYYLNGGSDAIVVRVHKEASKSKADLSAGASFLELEAANEGRWGDALLTRVEHPPANLSLANGDGDSLFSLLVKNTDTESIESFFNVSMNPDNRRYITQVLAQESQFVRVAHPDDVPDTRPNAHDAIDPGEDPFDPESSGRFDPLTGGLDGDPIGRDQLTATTLREVKRGIYALENADLFNLLYIPPFTREDDVDSGTLGEALAYCKPRRAILLVDAPSGWKSVKQVVDDTRQPTDSLTNALRDENAAIFWPRVLMPDPLKENRTEEFGPCAAVAGVFARTDAQRGVWKAPAGIEANLRGVRGLSVRVTDPEQGRINPLGINALRTFPVIGSVVWGARTLRGADILTSEWKYLPVRRLALYLKESLYRGTQWAVFEPNDELLWSQIRLNIGAFMQNLFRQGAFKGKTPQEAYYVKCDNETTTQNDINSGIVNIVVGFAPLKPAEFVVLKFEQMAGQVQA
jgi:phage tail sheath protein FI